MDMRIAQGTGFLHDLKRLGSLLGDPKSKRSCSVLRISGDVYDHRATAVRAVVDKTQRHSRLHGLRVGFGSRV